MSIDNSKFNNKSEHRKFAIGLAVILTVISAVQWYLHVAVYSYLLGAAGVILVVGLLTPVVIKPVFIIFSYIGFVMGWVMTRVVLSLLFYLVFTPIGLVLKLTGKKLLDTSFRDQRESYWIDRGKGQDVDFTRQF